MIFHKNGLLANNSHEISYLIFFEKLGKMLQNLSSAAVLTGALRVKIVNISLFSSLNICFLLLKRHVSLRRFISFG